MGNYQKTIFVFCFLLLTGSACVAQVSDSSQPYFDGPDVQFIEGKSDGNDNVVKMNGPEAILVDGVIKTTATQSSNLPQKKYTQLVFDGPDARVLKLSGEKNTPEEITD